ncbi:hypothetical protein J2T14_006126 [Paenibacillus harenae]|nr:hypothetical protein [Paenibacillus harenae]
MFEPERAYELTERVLLWLRGMELGDQDNNNR